MNLAAISDSAASLAGPVPTCPTCATQARVDRGTCLSCLLRSALDETLVPGGDEDFDEVLSAIEVRDTEWRLGNYHIFEEIGRGGMGVIYRARQRHSKRIVALKRVLGYHGDSRETLERFRREAEAAASLDHPNILPIYEVSEADGLPFFTMKYATGGSLQEAAPALSADPRECVRLVAKVTRAVAYAHREGILHRDLKPGNILLDGRREPMVSDFGLAKWIDADSDLTRSLAIFGTPGFIAPEQAEGDRRLLTAAADVYSLGAILFDLLSGRPPFLAEHALAVIRQAAEKPAPKLRSLVPHADRDLETICAKCLERDPQVRYRAAADLAEDLERWLEGRAIVARPVSPPTKAWRWAKRNPALVGTAALCLAVAGFALLRQVHGWQLQKEINARIAAHHSIHVEPLLDLDTAQPSEKVSSELGTYLARNLNGIGPAKVTMNSSLSGSAPARALLSGTTRIVNGKRRLSLHLLEANSRTPLLHEIIEGDPAAAPRAAARQIATRAYQLLFAADLRTLGTRTTDPGLLDPEAKSFITQGTALASRRGGLDLDRAIACLRHAIELQPESAAAHAALAKVMGQHAAVRSSTEHLETGLQHAQKAVALDSASAEAHVGLAALLHHRGKMKESIEQTLRSLELSPTSRRAANLLANIHKSIGRPDLTLRWVEVAKRNNEATSARDSGIADCFAYLGEDEKAESLYEHDRKLYPEQPEGWMGICRLRLLSGRVEEARAIYQKETKGYADFSYARQMAAQVEFFGRNFAEAEKLYRELYERDPGGGGYFYGAVSYASALGRLKMESDPARGRELLERAHETETSSSPDLREDPRRVYRLAAIAASLGQIDDAVNHLEAAAAAGWIDHRSLALDPRFDALRHDDRFAATVERLEKTVAQLREGTLPVGDPIKQNKGE